MEIDSEVPLEQYPLAARPRRRIRILAGLVLTLLVLAAGSNWLFARNTRSTNPGSSAADDARGYRLNLTADGAEIRWDPCVPIHYVTNLQHAPYSTAQADVEHAIAEVSKDTGLKLIYDGERSVSLRSARVDETARTGQRDQAPLTIGWASKTQTDILDGKDTDGTLGETEVSASDQDPAAIIGATVVLNTAAVDYTPGFGAGKRWGSILLHELGHAVGLDHVGTQGELMQPEAADDLSSFGPGDLAGLKEAGSGPCATH